MAYRNVRPALFVSNGYANYCTYNGDLVNDDVNVIVNDQCEEIVDDDEYGDCEDHSDCEDYSEFVVPTFINDIRTTALRDTCNKAGIIVSKNLVFPDQIIPESTNECKAFSIKTEFTK